MKIKTFSIGLATVLALVGCQGLNDNQEGRTGDRNNNVQPTRYNDDHNTNRNQNIENRRNDMMRNDQDGMFEDYRDNRGDVINNRDRNRNRNTTNTRNISNNRNNEYNVSEEAADRIVEKMDEIDNAYVLTTNNNAYVAAMLDNDGELNRNKNMNNTENSTRNDRKQTDRNDDGEELTDDVKKEISDIVQSVDNNIDNVYVTTNPDFADLVNNYTSDFNNGKPVRGLFDQIGNAIERLFPQNNR